MRPFEHPTDFSGVYPNWAGYTYLDFDAASNAYHPGDDYNWGVGGDADLGKPVWNFLKGKVVYSGSDTVGYGNMIVIEHALGAEEKKFIKDNYAWDVSVIYSLYAHLQIRYVAVGNVLDTDALIGRVGKSGNSPWAHLHFEIYRGDLDLKDKPWRFYPIGWSKELIKKNWLPPFPLIQKSKSQPVAIDYKAKCNTLKIATDRLNKELISDLANPSVNYEAVYNATRAKAKKIADTGTL